MNGIVHLSAKAANIQQKQYARNGKHGKTEEN